MAKHVKVLRCYAKRDGDQWVAMCIDLCLAAQADSFEEAKGKLEAQIIDYINEACTVDREHINLLLNRKAPLANRLEYRFFKTLSGVASTIPDAIRSMGSAISRHVADDSYTWVAKPPEMICT